MIHRRHLLSLSLCGLFAACTPPPQKPAPTVPAAPNATAAPDGGPATAAEAADFVKRFNEEGARISLEGAKAAWVQNTYITPDTQWLAAKARERWLTFRNEMIDGTKRFNDLTLEGDVGRSMKLIKTAVTMPAPRDPQKLARLAELAGELKSAYGTGKYCKKDSKGDETCRDLEVLTELMAKSRDYDELLDAWTGWRTVSPPMRKGYQEFASLMNDGARELAFGDTGELWRSGYDMSADAFEKEADRLWQQVKPLYRELHCHVRAKLSEHYGPKRVPASGPIPAHLLGNMWAQEWNNIFELVKPYDVKLDLDVSGALKKQKYTPEKMVRSAESFYTSLGLQPLPKSFYQRSMLVKPRDRDVVCHASAWDIDPPNDDLRIKMCIDPTEEELVTIYHELGHIYYYVYYKNQPFLFQSGAHDGFHEAIGDALTLSMTPSYYQRVGLIDAPKGKGQVTIDGKVLVNQQLKMALEKIAFLPFGKMIDQWRWDVFNGKVAPGAYNTAWWKLRTEYQGIAPPVARSEAHFDPGAKYHIPANTPYTRYFLARILQFQFHRSMCQAAGHKGPLHECSIYGSKAAGAKLASMLEMGQSQPWPDALEKLTGSRQMDASAIVDYFAPLMKWLEEQNKGRTCGW